MPLLEAPTNFDDESSPENSMATELEAGNAVPVAAQLRIHTPEPQQALARGNNNVGAFRLPTIRLYTPRTYGGANTQQQTQAAPLTISTTSPRIQRTAAAGLATDIFNDFEAEVHEAESWLRIGLAPPPPPVVNLLPVTLPPQSAEPQLDELLRRVTQRTDLHNVETVRLRVISAITVSLSRLAMFLPRLQHLNLSGSVLCSLRDLGCGLLHLAYLDVSNCGLNSFDGTSGMPSLRELTADGNMIQRVGPLVELPLLQRLSARNNRISDLSLLTFLAMCPNLNEVSLQGNPVCHQPLYRHTLQRNVSTLRLIDGTTVEMEAENSFNAESSPTNSQQSQQVIDERVAALNRRNTLLCREASTTSTASTQSSSSLSSPNTASEHSSEQQAAITNMPTTSFSNAPMSSSSSSSSESFSSATSATGAADTSYHLSASVASLNAIRHLRRPATAPTENNSTPAHDFNRPASAQLQQPVLTPGVASSLIVGSVLDLVRQQRRYRNGQRYRNAWISDNNESTSSEASSIASSAPIVEF